MSAASKDSAASAALSCGMPPPTKLLQPLMVIQPCTTHHLLLFDSHTCLILLCWQKSPACPADATGSCLADSGLGSWHLGSLSLQATQEVVAAGT